MYQKKCTRCKQVKSLDDFHVSINGRDGHRSECKVCHCNRERLEYYCKHNSKAVKEGIVRELKAPKPKTDWLTVISRAIRSMFGDYSA